MSGGLRVLTLAVEAPPAVHGGLGVAVGGFAAGLRAREHAVRVLTPQGGAPERAEQRSSTPFPDPYAGPWGDAEARASAPFAEAAARVARAWRPDVIHAHEWSAFEAGLAARAARDAPLVAHVHSCAWDRDLGLCDPYPMARERAGLLAADAVIATSARTAQDLERLHGLARGRAHVVHPPAPWRPRLRAPRDPARPPSVLFLGRVVRQKGPELFLRCAEAVQRARPDARFLVAGDGAELEPMIERSAAVGLARSLRFAGWLSRRDTRRALERSDVLLVPSLREPFGLVALEAAAVGVAVVATQSAGFLEVLEPFASFAPLDADAATEATLRALHAPEARRQWADRARAALDSHTPIRAAEALERALLSLRRPPARQRPRARAGVGSTARRAPLP